MRMLQRESSSPASGGAGGCCKADPISDHTAGVLQYLEAMAVSAPLLERADDALDLAVCSEQCGVMNSWRSP